MNTILATGVPELARAQDLVLSRRQLAEHGITDKQIRAAVRARTWQAFGALAVVLHNTSLTHTQRVWAAVLNAGSQGGAAAGLTAAATYGLRGYDSADVHLLLPRGARITAIAGVQVHFTRRPLAMAVHPSRLPAMTRLERSLVDAAGWAANDRDACAILAAAVQQGLTTAHRLVAEVMAGARLRRRKLLLLTLHDIGCGAHSLAELDLVRLARRAGIPAPLLQEVRKDSSGRRRYLDAVFPFRSDRSAFAVEVDGALHLQPETYSDDMTRANDVVISGTPVLRFSALTLRLDPEAVVRQLRRMYESR